MIEASARTLAVLLALWLSGCETVSPERPPPQPVVQEWTVESALAFAERFAGLGPEAQRQETNELMAAFARDHDEAARLRLALALGTPGTAVSDDTRAAALLEPLAAPATQPRTSMRQLAAVLHGQINGRLAERRRGDTLKVEADSARSEFTAATKQLENARADLKELKELRVQLENVRREAESQRAQAEAARAQAEAVRQQLEALKAVERTMIERGAPPPPRSPK